MSEHLRTLRPAHHKARNLWSVGCSCGWRCAAPMRGKRDRAVEAFTAHLAEVKSEAMGRLMRQAPRGGS